MATEAPTKPATTAQRQSTEVTRTGTAGAGRLESDHGATTIVDNVVAKVAGIAAREVAGVHATGGQVARSIGSVTSKVGLGDDRGTGVSVEVGQRQAAADLVIVIEYGESIPRVTQEVRENVIARVESLVGLEVTEVNITVNDLHFEGDEDTGASRVQ